MLDKETLSASFSDFLKGVMATLNQPISLTGAPLSPSQARKRRAEKARNRLLGRATSGTVDARGASGEMSCHGRIGKGRETPLAVDGQDLIIDSGTLIIGELKAGVSVQVKALMTREGKRRARSIIVDSSPA